MTVAEAMARRFNELLKEATGEEVPLPCWEEMSEGTRARLVTIFTTLLKERRINPYLPAEHAFSYEVPREAP